MPTKERGLSSTEAKKILEEHGENVLSERPPPSNFYFLISQFKSPLVYILLVAGVITFALGQTTDTVIIFLSVAVNTILGFIQERRAGKALMALKHLIHPTSKVYRDGKLVEVESSQIVPGDVVVLNKGSKVPADGKLLVAENLFISEGLLTGESEAVVKKKGLEAFMGTIITAGHGVMLIKKTGEATQIGKIAESVQEPSEDTPLKQQLSRFSRKLTLLVFSLAVFVLVVGVISGMDALDIFSTSVALAVSAIPEGLLVGLTVVLAIGMQRILKRKGLVRNLVSAETLGGVTTICIDKTGTLTEGKMGVVNVVGDETSLVRQALLANDRDDPIVIAAYNWAKKNTAGYKSLLTRHKRIDSISFSSSKRFFASLHKWTKEENVIFVNGAPDMVIGWSNLNKEEIKDINSEIKGFTSEGKRVLGMARKKVLIKNKLNKSDLNDLEWVGLLAFSDPVREGVKSALEKTKEAGINLIVITGDYAQTAISVMNQVGLSVDKDGIVLGRELEQMSTGQLARRLKDPSKIKLFAKTSPEQKLKIVESLKANGQVVAMMGDGVNDAPALKKADIGIVVGEATDVAKETADLVLLDSNFDTIIAAIEEGRGIYDNLRKIILYLMSDAFGEILAVVGAILLGLPLPVTAAQILWINLVSDGFPDLALTIDPKSPGIMQRHPRPTNEGLVTPWMRSLILIVSISAGITALILFTLSLKNGGDLKMARSVAFAALGMNSLVYVFSIRTLRLPFWKVNPLANKWLIVAVFLGLILQLSPFIILPLRNFFGVVPLPIIWWVLVFASSAIMFIIIEGSKTVFRKHMT